MKFVHSLLMLAMLQVALFSQDPVADSLKYFEDNKLELLDSWIKEGYESNRESSDSHRCDRLIEIAKEQIESAKSAKIAKRSTEGELVFKDRQSQNEYIAFREVVISVATARKKCAAKWESPIISLAGGDYAIGRISNGVKVAQTFGKGEYHAYGRIFPGDGEIRLWVVKSPKNPSVGQVLQLSGIVYRGGNVTYPTQAGGTSEATLICFLDQDEMDREIKKRVPEEDRLVPEVQFDLRNWETADKKFSVLARYVSGDSKSVTLRKEDGKEITIDVLKLSKADRIHVKYMNQVVMEFDDLQLGPSSSSSPYDP